MNNKIMAAWGLIIIAIVLVILIYGIKYKKEHPYLKLEHEIKAAAKEYIKNYKGIKPDDDIELTITSEELQKNGYLEELKYDDKKCTGEIVVTQEKRKYKYNSSIKCQ